MSKIIEAAFDKIKHEYRIGGRVVPGVTQLFKDMGLIDDKHFDDYSCNRGTYVHDATVMLDNGSLDEDSLSEPLRPYLAGYKDFLKHIKPKMLFTEQDLYDEVLGFAGKPDRICIINKVASILEIKTGAALKIHRLQTAGYKILARNLVTETAVLNRYILYLSSTGKYKLEQHNDRGDEFAFQAILGAYHAKRAYGNVKEETK